MRNVNEITNRQQRRPSTDMNEILKKLPQNSRSGYMCGIQTDTDGNSDDGKLIPVEKDTFPVGFYESRYITFLFAVLIVISHGEKNEEHDQILENPDNL